MAITNRNRLLEKYIQVVRMDGLNTNIGIAAGGSTASLSVGTGGIVTTGAFDASTIQGSLTTLVYTPVAVNATATLTAAQVAGGYITSTSAAAVTMTLPTGTLLGAAVNAVQSTVFDLYIDNTAGANTVTIAVAVNGILSAPAVAGTAAGAGLLTVPSGVTGQACFRIMFSSSTAYTFTRIA